MGQILAIQDDEKVGALLDVDHAVVRVAGADDLRRVLSTQRFQGAVVASHAATEMLTVLREMDPDLAVIVVADPDREISDHEAWEILEAPVPSETLRAAVRRSIQHTESLREIRTLRSQFERGSSVAQPVANGGSAVTPEHLTWITTLPPRLDLRELLSSVEKGVIRRTLEATRGAQAEAARRLNLSRSDLSYKLAKYELRKTNGTCSA
jgi:DNA-binding NtrC family response regulator